MNKIYISWQEFDEMVNVLASEIKADNKQFNRIYGLPRGGLPMAVCLSHKLNLSLITNTDEITENTLIVDDISDIGTQLQDFYDLHCTIATLHSTNWTTSPPNYHVSEKLNKEDWIVYPWENADDNDM